MEQVRKIRKQAYSTAPWRKQKQMMGTFLLVVVVTALVAFMYLNTTAQAATYGRQIQEMQVNLGASPSILDIDDPETPEESVSIEELRVQIADLEAQLGILTAQTVVEERIKDLDLEPNDPEKVVYLVVEGYYGRPDARIAPSPQIERASVPVLPEVYKQSLLDWFKQQVVQTSHMIMEEVSP